jgi:hypothetical protein
MAWIRTFDKSEATGRLADVFAELKRPRLRADESQTS